MHKKILIAALILGMVLTACGPAVQEQTTQEIPTEQPTQLAATESTQATTEPTQAATVPDTIKIGFVAPLTTANALMGWSMQQGAQLAAQEINDAGGINGVPLELIIEDNSNTADVAVNAINRVLSENPVALILGSTSAQTLAMEPIILENTLPTIIMGSSPSLTDQGNPWVFATRADDGFAATAAVKFAVEDLGAKKVGIFHAAEEFGTSVAPIIISALAEYGLEPAAVVSAPSTDKDYSAQLLELQAADVDVILVWVLPAPGILLARQMKQLGMDTPVVANPVFGLSQVLVLMTPEELAGIYSMTDCVPSQSTDEKILAFVQAYKDRTGTTPDLFGALSYDSVKLFADVITQVGTDLAAIQAGLFAVTGWPGVCHNYSFDAKGRGGYDISTVDISTGTLKVVGTVSK
ncbi:MAG: hypothetical protein A2X25_06325 [Chloroflexi bacterium GWB2_49_20]|nr:MAG: hypothetical protein A2X25_06325 [Chloroflexi bacterium GWB2_49_20]OGN80342.1 MAG: hypothetical protein A2X26_08455 [Chloroflexi bacterium GWC2_49_37]OGN85668.1 MAG: hypothetical protein A2X27_13590 [Chloroflexi bacterium GWD2_49_16]